jgi:hypothetical protein
MAQRCARVEPLAHQSCDTLNPETGVYRRLRIQAQRRTALCLIAVKYFVRKQHAQIGVCTVVAHDAVGSEEKRQSRPIWLKVGAAAVINGSI